MTIDEAIELKERELSARSYYPDSKHKQADKLSLEALKRIRKEKSFPYTLPYPLLPGETEE